MQPALVIRGLTKTYGNGVTALKSVDLDVGQGDFFALLGPNGAGKSTILGIVSSLINKTSGQISVMGHDLDTQREKAKQCLGVVPQEFNFNVFEKVKDILITQAGYYGIPFAKASVSAERYLKALGLWDKRGEQARSLSGGMKRRLMIARALVHEPQILILDEPTAGVDIELRRTMWSFLTDINREGKTIILTTHYLEEAEALCRNIAIIDKGSILENTSKKSLLAKLQKETFVLEIDRQSDGRPARDFTLEGLAWKLNDDDTLEVEILKGGSLNGVFRALDEVGVSVGSVRPKANRLEELFIHLVRQN
jgi:ABC-2 type transport system ATP-binding protein